MKPDLKALKMRVDLVAVIQAHGVPLKQKGANFVARCPFKTEKTASFTVSPTKRIFKCFGCGVGGDVFKFLELKANLTLPHAIEWAQSFVGETGSAAPAASAVVTMAPIDARAVDRPPQAVLDRVIALWQKELANVPKAQGYLKARALWRPELIRALRIGYASGSLPRTLPGGGKLRRQLTQMGILTKRSTEFFYRRLVIPIFDETGVLVNVYGRAIDPDNECKHLYLAGAQRGVFNRPGVAGAQDVILTEAPLDAISLLALGYTHVTSSYGANVFPADLRAELVRGKTRRVYCVYDPDPAGDHAADQLAHDLATHGIEVVRVALPEACKDPNDFLRDGGTRDQFQALMDAARPVCAPRPAAVSARVSAAPTPPPIAPTAAASPAPADPPLELVLGDRTYQFEGEPVRAGDALSVRVRASRDGRRWVETFNVNSPHRRSVFVRNVQAAFRGQVPRKTLEDDFFALFDAIQDRAGPAPDPTPAAAPVVSMTPADRDEGLEFLRRPDLIARILADFVQMGVVGEDDNKLLVYLVATSRKLPHPLSLSFVSGSSGGKSWILNRALDLMPPEEVCRFTRMSPRALFYDEPDRYKHKILHVEEAIGAKDADLGVRSMQSEQRLSNLTTVTDPKTGKLKTQETVVEGPLAYMTSSVEPLDYETSTRSFEVAIDESPEQTGRIVTRALAAQSLAGIQEKLTHEAIIQRHHNAQRLLEPLAVVNPYAGQLTFPSHTLRLRREVDKYIGLMNTLAVLFQYQRPIKTFTDPCGRAHRYVEVARADVGIANRLMATHLTRMIADLPGTSLPLLLKIQEYVTAEAQARGVEPMAVTFNRRQVRDWLEWPDRHLLTALEHLVKLEFIEVASGSFGKRYVYTLTPDHRVLVAAGLSIDERIEALGLTPVSRLKDPAP